MRDRRAKRQPIAKRPKSAKLDGSGTLTKARPDRPVASPVDPIGVNVPVSVSNEYNISVALASPPSAT